MKIPTSQYEVRLINVFAIILFCLAGIAFSISGCQQPTDKRILNGGSDSNTITLENRELIKTFTEIDSFLSSEEVNKNSLYDDSVKRSFLSDLRDLTAAYAGGAIEYKQYRDFSRNNPYFNAQRVKLPTRNSSVTVDAFLAYYKKYINPLYYITGGVRFSYGLYNDSIVTILSVASSDIAKDDAGYCVINKAKYTGQNSLINNVASGPQDYKKIMEDYKLNVYINEVKQVFPNPALNDYDSSKHIYKLSRFYNWSELTHLMIENVYPFNDNSFAKCLLNIEHGYIDLKGASHLDKRIIDSAFQHASYYDFQGHTTLLSISDATGFKRVRSKTGVLISKRDLPNYYMKSEEIGNPWPPRCPN